MKKQLKKAIRSLPYLKGIYDQLDDYSNQVSILTKQLVDLEVPPGHFYSPIPSFQEVRSKEKEIFENRPREIPGINLNEEKQLKLFGSFKAYYDEQPFSSHKVKGLRYYFENYLYPYSDAIFLYCMMRHYQPQTVIEIGGSGYSSCLILDTNERFLDEKLSCICIEPHPENIFALLNEKEETKFQLIRKHVQDVELEYFQQLSHNDILFIDSTHISKINSDVNYILFQVLPSLKSGVLIHFHDVFYPFEYPKEWVYNKRVWNEMYTLRAFLQYNKTFEIEFFNTFLQYFYHDLFVAEMPLCLKGVNYEWNGHHTWGGGSIWLRKM
ncbi:class I SAM-dependent methyltransferase [Leptolyngbya sp. FACHB-16]|uniref:class I SAM-dependent methyltransferase n=1 Tax=unclassified Leptolyngbya TaxID=2650499 RepID=UPI001683188E|nr:class I SAM-dependent methyltransferase [Leptolyngbya sp. FACHB-16]MBD2158903.1 class I SAM-dependent methyltransferase [Leptolyngbya sp. FACHB-16]